MTKTPGRADQRRLAADSIRLKKLYDALLAHFGHRRWWPAKTPFEVCGGAILTQNTAWTNVTKAIANLALPLDELRSRLLAMKGIGEETADSIILYAAGKPIFVVDAYTRRILARKGMIREGAGYEETQRFLEGRVPRDASAPG